jgi:muconolactone delta-isomerase
LEFLVTMTTHVPDGTASGTVDDIRGREAAHSRELAADGHLLRLWRPPLQPGEWRTLGLFAADDAAQLEEVLASMPLRVWRTDEVTPLSPHPNDPAASQPGGPIANITGVVEFLVEFDVTIPDGTPEADVRDRKDAEAVAAAALAEQGHLVRLWNWPAADGTTKPVGLYRAESGTELEELLGALPLAPWMDTAIIPLNPHPNDPMGV